MRFAHDLSFILCIYGSSTKLHYISVFSGCWKCRWSMQRWLWTWQNMAVGSRSSLRIVVCVFLLTLKSSIVHFFVIFTLIIFIIQKQHNQSKYKLQGWGRHLPSVLFIRQEDVRRCWSSLKSCIVSFILRLFCWWWASPISFITSLT